MKNNKRFRIKLLRTTLITAAMIAFVSCNNNENPGNNTGKTGNGAGADSLNAKRNDTGKGANRLQRLIREKRDSIN